MYVKVIFAAIYGFNWLVIVAMKGFANGTLKDPSPFVPLVSAMNLCLTCLAGVCVWGDLARLQFRFAYALIYVLILLGIYDVSDFDFGQVKKTNTDANSIALRRSVRSCDTSTFVSHASALMIGISSLTTEECNMS